MIEWFELLLIYIASRGIFAERYLSGNVCKDILSYFDRLFIVLLKPESAEGRNAVSGRQEKQLSSLLKLYDKDKDIL